MEEGGCRGDGVEGERWVGWEGGLERRVDRGVEELGGGLEGRKHSHFSPKKKKVNAKQKQGLSPCTAKYSPPPPPSCVPSDSLSQSATVSICQFCCTWFGY